MSDPEFYATQSTITDPGELDHRLDELPGDLESLQEAARQLVFHYRAGGDFEEHGIAPEWIAEINTRYGDRMLARLLELQDFPLTEERPPHRRLVGCCRSQAGSPTLSPPQAITAHSLPSRTSKLPGSRSPCTHTSSSAQ